MILFPLRFALSYAYNKPEGGIQLRDVAGCHFDSSDTFHAILQYIFSLENGTIMAGGFLQIRSG